MKTIDISATKRSEIGKTGSKALRASNMIPCVVYFNGEATHISISDRDLRKVLFSPETYLININLDSDNIGGESFQAVVKNADFHPVKDRVLHVEFLKATADKEVEVSLPLALTGTAVGVTKGGKLMQKLRKIKVKGFVKDLPDSIKVNISHMDLGGNILVKDVDFGSISITSPATAAIASVEIPRSLRSAMQKGG